MTRNNDLHPQAARDVAGHLDRRELDCSLSVNEVLGRYPSTRHVFNRFGVDTCCGGVLSVADAARANDLDEAALCGALKEALLV